MLGILYEGSGPIPGGQIHIKNAANAWADWVNKNGGIAGHPVKLQLEDTAGDPAKAAVAVKNLIDAGVVSIQIYSSSTEKAVGKSLSDSGLVISGQGYDTGTWGANIRTKGFGKGLVLPGLPNFFNTATSISAIVDTQAAAGAKAGLKTFAVATCAEVPACAQAEPLYKGGAAENGLAYKGVHLVAAAAANYTAECTKVIADGVDFFQISTDAGVGVRIVKDCLDQNYAGWFGASGGTADQTLVDTKVNWAGGINGFPWWVDDAPVAEFRKVMEDAKAEYRTPTVTGLWANLQLFRKVLSSAGDTVTKADVMKAYTSVKGETLDGLVPGPLNFQAAGAPPVAINCVWLYALKDGKFNNPNGGLKAQCFSATPPP